MINDELVNLSGPHLSSKNAAKYTCCADSTMKISRVTGMLLGYPAPSYRKIGRKVIYDKAVLDAWLDQFGTKNNTAS